VKTDADFHLLAAIAVVALFFGLMVICLGLMLPNPVPRF
jgi:hypothetical protein